MATAQEARELAEASHELLDALDSKLDEVRVGIAALKEQIATGGPVTQEQLDALAASLESLKVKAQERLAEASALLE